MKERSILRGLVVASIVYNQVTNSRTVIAQKTVDIAITDTINLCEQCPTVKKNASQENVHEAQNATINTSSQMDSKQVILLHTAQVEAVGEHATVPVRLLLDNGSQLSYITTSLRSRLKLKPVCQDRLALNTFGSDSFIARVCDVVNLTLQRSGFNERLEIVAHTSPVICSNLPVPVNVNTYTNLQGFNLADNGNLPHNAIDILIGSDSYWQVVAGDMVNGDCGPVAMNSIFGWLLFGPVSHPLALTEPSTHLYVVGKDQCTSKCTQIDCLVQMLKSFWDNESVGICDATAGEQSIPFLPEIQFDGIKYEIKLPWKENYPSQITFTYALIV